MTDTSGLDMQGVVLHGRYEICGTIGSGAFSSVYRALDRQTGRDVAVKLNKWGIRTRQARHVSRELLISRHMSAFADSKYVPQLLDAFPWSHTGAEGLIDFDGFAMVHELMKADLRSTIRNGQLGEEDIVEIMYGLAVSLRQLHSAGIVHRDVKPNNVLLDTTPDDTEFVVKMTDFGLSRGINSVKDAGVSGEPMTDYVITRWYRPPEILLGDTHYTTAADVWSLGCVFAEMWHGNAIFRGKNSQNQLSAILEYTGTPYLPDLSPGCAMMPALVESVKFGPRTRGRPISSLFATGKRMPPPLCLDLIQSMLTWNPAKRPSLDHVLRHPFFAQHFAEEDLPVAVPPFDDRLENVPSTEPNFRAHCLEPIFHFNPHLLDQATKDLLRRPQAERMQLVALELCEPLKRKLQQHSQQSHKAKMIADMLEYIRPAGTPAASSSPTTTTTISPQKPPFYHHHAHHHHHNHSHQQHHHLLSTSAPPLASTSSTAATASSSSGVIAMEAASSSPIEVGNNCGEDVHMLAMDEHVNESDYLLFPSSFLGPSPPPPAVRGGTLSESSRNTTPSVSASSSSSSLSSTLLCSERPFESVAGGSTAAKAIAIGATSRFGFAV